MYPGTWSKRIPNKLAAIDATREQSISYQELDARSNQFVQYLYDKGFKRGDKFAVYMENNLAFFVASWAGLRSGLYVVAVNSHLTADEAAYVINDSQAKALVTTQEVSKVSAEIPEKCPNCHHWLSVDGDIPGFDDFYETIGEFPKTPLENEPTGSFMHYSSGTTGKPKGIFRPLPETFAGEEDSPFNTQIRALWQINESSVYLSPAPLYHSAPSQFCIGVQAVGATVIIMRGFDPVSVLEHIQTYKVTHSQWVPTMFTRMLKLPKEVRSQYDLSSQQVAIHAAAPCPKEVKIQMMDWWGPIIHEYYAGTEMNGFTYVSPHDWLDHPGTVGKPLLGTVHICDEQGQELPTGATGIVYFELPQITFSYYNDDKKMSEAVHPEQPLWTTLGDMGYLDAQGFLYLTDRATFMIISGGVNIYPQEIEDTIILHDSVVDVAVIGVPNKEMGEQVKAVVQLQEGVQPTEELASEILSWTRERIAHYKCPKSLDFRDSLPRLPTGKLAKRYLRDEYWETQDSRIV